MAATAGGGAPITVPRLLRWVGAPVYGLVRGRAMELPALDALRRILVIRLDGLGDLLLTTPTLRELRRCAPRAKITLLVSPANRNLVETCPYIDEVLTYPSGGRIRGDGNALVRASRHAAAAARLIAGELWSRDFELALLPRWDVDSHHAGLIAYLSGARWRAGYSQDDHPGRGATTAGQDRLLTHVLHDRTVKHELVRDLDLLRFVGGSVRENKLELWLTSEDRDAAGLELRRAAVSAGQGIVAICPGAGTAAKKLWPLERFGEVGRWLSGELGLGILVIGGAQDADLGGELVRRIGPAALDLTGRKTLRQTAALLARCRLCLGNDTGPVHLAAAAGVPVVEVSSHPADGDPSHAGSPERFGPRGVPHRLCRPAHATPPCLAGCESLAPHCILQVTVAEVRAAVEGMLAAGPAKTGSAAG